MSKHIILRNLQSKVSSRGSRRQHGAAVIVGVSIITLLLLVAAGFGYFALTSKSKASLTVVPPTVTANDSLTQGKTNNELLIDTMIISKAIDRDEDQRKVAEAALADKPLPVGDGVTTSTTVEAQRLSQLQTEFIGETDRRLKILADLSSVINKLASNQKTILNKLVADETTVLTGLKAKAASETTQQAFLSDRDELDKEYVNFTLAVAQTHMLFWADDQAVLYTKVNVLGGKFQERLNAASDQGTSVAKAQISLNSYQTNKTTIKDNTTSALQLLTDVKPNTFNANRAVLKSYYNRLATSHNELKKALVTSQDLLLQIRAFK
jgi:hypothetical protein